MKFIVADTRSGMLYEQHLAFISGEGKVYYDNGNGRPTILEDVKVYLGTGLEVNGDELYEGDVIYIESDDKTFTPLKATVVWNKDGKTPAFTLDDEDYVGDENELYHVINNYKVSIVSRGFLNAKGK